MGVTIILPPDVMAMAKETSERRPLSVPQHRRNPSADPMADWCGATAEYAMAVYCGLPYTAVQSEAVEQPDGRWGDGGVDFIFKNGKVKVDVKSSRRHRESFIVPGRHKEAGEWVEGLKSDWYVFAFVTLPAKVELLYKAHRDVLIPIGPWGNAPTKRIVFVSEGILSPFEDGDFRDYIPKKAKVSPRSPKDRGA